MTSSIERVQELRRGTTAERLLKGASVLGHYWRENVRCEKGWGRICECKVPNDFCRAKLKWLGLLMDSEQAAQFADPSWTGDEPFFVIEAMNKTQFEASGLTALIEIPGLKEPLRVGANGQNLDIFDQLAAAPDGIEALKKIQKVFLNNGGADDRRSI